MVKTLEVEFEEGAHVARIRAEQLQLLVAAVHAAEQDHEALCTMLRLERPADKDPHWFFEHAILPRLAALVAQADTHIAMQAEAQKMVEKGIKRFGKTTETVQGKTVQKVGQRIENMPLIATAMPSRRERREWERKNRRG